LAIPDVGIPCAGTTLRFEVRDGRDEPPTRAVDECLCERRAVTHAERTRAQRCSLADRPHARRLVDERDSNRIETERVAHPELGIGIDERERLPGRIQLVDKIGQRTVLPVAVVLDLAQPPDIGFSADDRRDGLRPLPIELCRVARAATASALARDAALTSLVAKRVEIVLQIEAGDLQLARSHERQRGPHPPRLEHRRRVIQHAERPDSVLHSIPPRCARSIALGQHAVQSGDLRPRAQRVRRAEHIPSDTKAHRIRVLRLRVVIEHDAILRVVELHRERRSSRCSHVRRRRQKPSGAQRERSEATETRGVSHEQRLRKPHEHALIALQLGRLGERQPHLRGLDLLTPRGAVLDDRRSELRQRAASCSEVVLAHHPSDLHCLSQLHDVVARRVHEQRIGSPRIPIRGTAGVLQEKTAQRRLEIGDHHPLHGHFAAVSGGQSRPLHEADRHIRGTALRAHSTGHRRKRDASPQKPATPRPPSPTAAERISLRVDVDVVVAVDDQPRTHRAFF
jgi:hypothetical protein